MPPTPHLPPPGLRIAVAALLKPGSDGLRVLIARRPEGAIRGGLWEFPGGKMEPGESPVQAAARELGEETGVAVPAASGRVIAQTRHEDAAAPADKSLEFVLVAFHAQPDVHARPLASSECRWELLSALDQYEWPRANAELILRLRTWIAQAEHPGPPPA